MNSLSKERLDKMRESRLPAILFWEQWLLEVHAEWDGKEEQTFLLAPTQKMLPEAQYKQSVPLHPGMSEAEVNRFQLSFVEIHFVSIDCSI